MRPVKVAVQGCCHGELTNIYKSLPAGVKLLIICGDFQAIRNQRDMDTMNVPEKYKRLADFHDYYKGVKSAPVLTVFVGGNHESSSYMKELKFGGWVAPNIYYLGEFGSVWYQGLQIGGLSGIFNQQSFTRNIIKDETLPYDHSTIRRVYHVKPKNFLKMNLINKNLDIALSHDWPSEIEKFGNINRLLRRKPFFKADIEKGELGSPLNRFLIHYLEARYWFSAHLHVKYEAKIYSKDSMSYFEERRRRRRITKPESENDKLNNEEISMDMDEKDTKGLPVTDEISMDMDDEIKSETIRDDGKVQNSQEISIDMDGRTPNTNHAMETDSPPSKKPKHDPYTHFLALDKCLPKRQFLEVLDINVKAENINHPSNKYNGLMLSKRGVAINKVVEKYLQSHESDFRSINMANVIEDPTQLTLVGELLQLVDHEVKKMDASPSSMFEISPESFRRIAPTSDTELKDIPLKYWPNNQTEEYCKKFGIE